MLMLEKIKYYIQKKDLNMALKVINDYLENTTQINKFEVAILYYEIGEMAKASMLLKSNLTENKKHIDSYDFLFKIAKKINVADIENFIDLGKDIYNNTPTVLLELSHIYLSKEQYDKAINCLEEAYSLDNGNKQIAVLLAKIYIHINQYNKAYEILYKIYNSNVFEHDIIYYLIIIYQKQHKYMEIEKIIKNFEKYNIKQINLSEFTDVIVYLLCANDILKFSLESILKLSSYLKKELCYKEIFYNTSRIIIKKVQEYLLEEDKIEYIKSHFDKIIYLFPNIKDRLQNIITNETEIFNKKIELKSYPRVLEVTLTTKCNLLCKMCNNIRYEQWDLPINIKNEIIELMPCIERINWLGGEVFLYKHFEELLERARQYDVQQIISTNALLLNEKIIRKLLNANVEISISIDGVTKEIYENIRIGAIFEKLIKNIELINKLRKKIKTNTKIRMCSVILPDNYHQMKDFVKFAHKYDFDYITITPESNYLKTGIFNNKNDLAEQYEATANLAEQYNIPLENCMPKYNVNSDISYNNAFQNQRHSLKKIQISNNLIDLNKNYESDDKYKNICFSPWQKIFIDSLGFVKVNCNCPSALIIGDIEQDSIKSIWNNDRVRSLRKQIIDGCAKNFCKIDCLEGFLLKEKLRIIY